MTDLTFLSATQLATLLRQRAVSAEQVVRAHLARIEVVNPHLNAVVQSDPAQALARARAADAAAKPAPAILSPAVARIVYSDNGEMRIVNMQTRREVKDMGLLDLPHGYYMKESQSGMPLGTVWVNPEGATHFKAGPRMKGRAAEPATKIEHNDQAMPSFQPRDGDSAKVRWALDGHLFDGKGAYMHAYQERFAPDESLRLDPAVPRTFGDPDEQLPSTYGGPSRQANA